MIQSILNCRKCNQAPKISINMIECPVCGSFVRSPDSFTVVRLWNEDNEDPHSTLEEAAAAKTAARAQEADPSRMHNSVKDVLRCLKCNVYPDIRADGCRIQCPVCKNSWSGLTASEVLREWNADNADRSRSMLLPPAHVKDLEAKIDALTKQLEQTEAKLRTQAGLYLTFNEWRSQYLVSLEEGPFTQIARMAWDASRKATKQLFLEHLQTLLYAHAAYGGEQNATILREAIRFVSDM